MSIRYRLRTALNQAPALIVLPMLMTPLAAQWLSYPTPGIPRTAEGKPNLTAPAPRTSDGKPDLTGLWGSLTGTTDLKPDEVQPWVRALRQQRADNFGKDNPRYLCLPEGPTAFDTAQAMRRILQTPAMIAILHDDLTYRQIFMDGRALEADPSPSWMGYSVGHWDGETLVVESLGFNARTWLTQNLPHTDALRISERYRRIDFGHLEIETTINDPAAFSRPWTFRTTAQFAADTEIPDNRCDPADTGREHWTGSISEAQRLAVKVAPEVLAKYVGVYKGVWARRPRTVEITVSGDGLFISVEGRNPQRLFPQSETSFSGPGLGYNFIRDDHGIATDVIEMHVSGDYKLHRQE